MDNKFSTLKPIKSTICNNSATIKAYNRHVTTYIKNTPQDHLPHQKPMLDWIDYSLSLLASPGKILELGSATPRDARYIRAQGHFVQCSDGADGFVQYLKSQGEDALHLNVLTDTIEKGYDIIFANGVIQHFSKAEFIRVLHKVYDALQPGTYFVFSAKEGVGEEWIHEKCIYYRYVRYWQPNELARVLEDCGFKINFLEANAPGDLLNHRWIRVTAQR